MRQIRTAFALVGVALSLTPILPAQENPAQAFSSWGNVRSGPLDVRPKPRAGKKSSLNLDRGALVEVWKTAERGGKRWAQVRVLSLEKLHFETGWVDAGQLDLIPAECFPRDAEILRLLGGRYLDDFTAAHTEIARWLVAQGAGERVLLCFVNSRDLPTARLAAFLPSQGKFAPGPYLEFPSAELEAGMTSLEVRDLLGDGRECLVTHEPFRNGPETRGVNEVIRRIEDGKFRTLWSAPLEYRFLDAYPAKVQALAPPERNIGTPGTVTTGEVTFKTHGNISEPEWKGKVEFHVVGRDEPVNTLSLDKACPWDGKRFAPLY